MADEACSTYSDLIANVRAGHEFIKKEFGVTPRIGWVIDHFGHSSTNTRLMAEIGLEALFYGRADEREVNKRKDKKETEFIWAPSRQSLGDDVKMWCHIFPSRTYEPPAKFIFDILRKVDVLPFVSDPSHSQFNAPRLSGEFYHELEKVVATQKSEKNLFMVMGTDFSH